MVLDHLLQDRFRGAIVGTAVGDALGAPFEGRSSVDAGALQAWQETDAPLRWTDDTAMTIGVAQSLTTDRGFDGPEMARRFADAYTEEPWRGYGAGPPQIFAALRGGAAWDEPARRMFGGQGSFGNGAAMRVAPVGLWCVHDLSRVPELAHDTARITHAHDLARQGAAAQAHAVGWLAAAEAVRGQRRHTLLDDLRVVAPADSYRPRFDAIARMPQGVDPVVVRDLLGNGIAAVEAVPAALCAALQHPTEFAEAVTFAILVGGDTDTIAAMTGALVGAHVGHTAIPEPWRRRVEAHDELVSVADDLFDAVQESGARLQ